MTAILQADIFMMYLTKGRCILRHKIQPLNDDDPITSPAYIYGDDMTICNTRKPESMSKKGGVSYAIMQEGIP